MNVVARPVDPRVFPATIGAGGGSVRRLVIFDNFAAAETAWRRLEGSGAVYSPYQRFDWVELWHRHVSPHEGTSPLLVAGYDAAGEPLFLWPLARGRLGKLQVARFFGGKHATLNTGLWRRDFAAGLTAAALDEILARLSKICPDLDFLLLSNQPREWNGTPNPFALLRHQRSGEDNFKTRLRETGSDATRELSTRARHQLRNKEKKLMRLEGCRYLRAASPAEVDRLLDAFFTQKAAKLSALRLPNVFAEPGIEAFIRATCHAGLSVGAPLVELHALEGGGEMLALFSGIHDGRRFTSSFNSHTLGENARFSPGVILIRHLIAHCVGRGFEAFDIGPGEARYKSLFCKEFEPIFDNVIPLSARGRLAAWPLRSLLWLKSRIKRSRWLWPLVSALRHRLRRIAR